MPLRLFAADQPLLALRSYVQKRYPLGTVFVLGMLLSACQTSPQKPPSTDAVKPEQPAETSEADTAPAQSGLTTDLLYDLLVANFGYQRNAPQLATEALARAARNSNDPTLLAQATRTALHYQNTALATELGEKWIVAAPDEDAAYIVTALAQLQHGTQPDNAAEDTQAPQETTQETTGIVADKTKANADSQKQSDQARSAAIARSSQTLTRYIRKHSDTPDAAYQQLRSILTGHPVNDDILAVSRKLVALHPQSESAWLMHAALAEKFEDQATMNEALTALLDLNPEHETAAQYQLASMEKALLEQTTSTENETSQPPSQATAQTAAQTPDLAKISQFADDYLARNPSAQRFRQHYAQLLLRHAQTDAAMTQYQAILDHDDGHVETLRALGLLHFEQEQYAQAAKYLRHRVERVPSDDRSRVYLGMALHEIKAYEAAIIALERVRDSELRFAAQRNIALTIEEQAGADAALQYLAGLHPNDPEESVQILNDRINLLRRAKRLKAARTAIDEAMIAHPNNDSLRYNRALFLVELNDLANHRADMQVLLDKEPDNPNYLNTLGYTLLELGNAQQLDEARILIEKAFELKPNDPYITDSMGWVEFKLGNYPRAETLLKAAYNLDPDAEIAAHLGEVYWVQGRHEEARAIWAEGTAQNPENKALLETLERLAP